MSKFYGNKAYVGCGNGCNSKFQRNLLDDSGQPVDTDWEALREIYDYHNSVCSTDQPFTNDENAFYGNPDECTGFVVESEPDSGYKYCEY